ncbi:MAG: dephospho-CoA kinase [Chloroflexi bacterium]|nr:dephospho-CoA kinase [Chloroflexota bacterium]
MRRVNPYVIGLTGNIAVGKSTVAAMLAELGACVIDADQLAHEAMRPGTEVQRRIVAHFGPGVLDAEGRIDRRALGDIVFADAAALRALEQIVHPAVIAETLRRLATCTAPVAVVEAIKLIEAGMDRHCDAVWVVTASHQEQVRRLMETRSLTRAQAELRIDAQPPAEEKVARADVVIDNSATLDATWQQVVRAWNRIPGVKPVSAGHARLSPTGGECR